jgi:hypothetical protein
MFIGKDWTHESRMTVCYGRENTYVDRKNMFSLNLKVDGKSVTEYVKRGFFSQTSCKWHCVEYDVSNTAVIKKHEA